MPLETASTINELEPSNPASTDQLAQADEHLRLIKTVLLNTFPNITGPVTATQADLSLPPFTLPIGLILNWYGDSGTIPVGWAQCNGQTVTRSDGGGPITTPDLRDRVVVGAGTFLARGAAVGATTASGATGSGGSHSHAITGGGTHTHVVAVQAHAITEAEMPAHQHGSGVVDNSTVVFNHGTTSGFTASNLNTDSGGGTLEALTSFVGSGMAHGHDITIDPASTGDGSASTEGSHTHTVSLSTVQPSFGLHFIMKV
jgi:hypothetical protein